MLVKPEVKPISSAVFGNNGEICIYFYYEQDITVGNQEAEIKIFDINNRLKEVSELSFDRLEQVNKNEYHAFFKQGTANSSSLIDGEFYKASISINGSPWSNLTIFKKTSMPIITPLGWNPLDKKFFLDDSIEYRLSDDKTETLEKVEYFYTVDFEPLGKEEWCEIFDVETIYIQEPYNNNYAYTVQLKTPLDYLGFRESVLKLQSASDTFKINLDITFYTKNGQYHWNNSKFDRTVWIDKISQSQGILTPDEAYGRVYFNPQNIEYTLHRFKLYNHESLIGDFAFDQKPQSILDISAQYLNFYSLFGIEHQQKWILYHAKFDPVICDFNSVFLIDYKKNIQLNITLNNTINSFKQNLLETRVNTIGAQYPVFFRNPLVQYREFSLSGTISYHSLILFGNEYGLNYDIMEEFHKNLTGDNLYAERIFREKVIKFLTESEFLLYKSPTEGNIVVKLMNIQLTPNKTLGRMIYDFSCTCYEAQDLQSYLKECQEQ